MKSDTYYVLAGLLVTLMGLVAPFNSSGEEALLARVDSGKNGPVIIVTGSQAADYQLSLEGEGVLKIRFPGGQITAKSIQEENEHGLTLDFPSSDILHVYPVQAILAVQASSGEVRFTLKTATTKTENASGYVLGIGDKVRLNIYGDEQFSNKEMRVVGNGTVALPFVGEMVLAGLTVNEAAESIAQRLADGYLVDPKVSLEVIEYQSQWVNVSGQVNNPGRYYLEGPSRLVELIAQAGGMTREAGTTIRVTRPGQSGTLEQSFTISRDNLYRGNDQQANMRLVSGDTVVVSSEEYFYIKGEVRSPGRYALDEDTTILKAISIAGGFEQFAHHKKVEILRQENGESIRLVVNVTRIENRKAEDVRIRPGDIINVQARFL